MALKLTVEAQLDQRGSSMRVLLIQAGTKFLGVLMNAFFFWGLAIFLVV